MSGVVVTADNDVTRIHLDRGARRNALTPEMSLAVADAITHAGSKSTSRAIVLTASSPVYCAGADLDALRRDPTRTNELMFAMFRSVLHSDVPVITIVDGPAVGGGMALVGAATISYATPAASFSMPEVGLGFFPFGVVPFLQERLPAAVVLEAALSGRRITAPDAANAGFVNAVADLDDCIERVEALVGRLREVPAEVVADAIRWYRKLPSRQWVGEHLDWCLEQLADLEPLLRSTRVGG